MASVNEDGVGDMYRIEPSTKRSARSLEAAVRPGEAAVLDEDDVSRRVYYIRGQTGTERVVATIRARSRSSAIKIAADHGILVDRRELRDD